MDQGSKSQDFIDGLGRKVKIGYLVSHPIQYQAPLLRAIAQEPWADLTALFMSDFSVNGYYDAGFGKKVEWDVPLLEGYKSEFLPFVGKPEPVRDLKPWHTNLRQELAKHQFDILWTHGYAHATNVRAIFLAKKLNMKVLVRSDMRGAAALGTGVVRRVKDGVVKQIFDRIDGFLACGQLNADYYLQKGATPDRIYMMPYTVDNDFFQAKCAAANEVREAFRASLNLEPGRKIILFCSKLEWMKRITDMVEAFAMMEMQKSENPPYLLVVGDGPEREKMENAIAATGLKTIKCVGFKNQTELPSYFDLCDLFVMPGHHERWGLIVNEVMNAAKPIVLSDEIGAAPDLVRPGVNGFVFPFGDLPQLAKHMDEILSNDELAQRMGQASLEMINQWGQPQAVHALRTAIEGVLKR